MLFLLNIQVSYFIQYVIVTDLYKRLGKKKSCTRFSSSIKVNKSVINITFLSFKAMNTAHLFAIRVIQHLNFASALQ